MKGKYILIKQGGRSTKSALLFFFYYELTPSKGGYLLAEPPALFIKKACFHESTYIKFLFVSLFPLEKCLLELICIGWFIHSTRHLKILGILLCIHNTNWRMQEGPCNFSVMKKKKKRVAGKSVQEWSIILI